MRTRGTSTLRGQARELAVGEVAWITLVPCAALLLAAIVVLGPPLGHAITRTGSEGLWPPHTVVTEGRPEPVEHGRYALAMLGPLLLVGVVLASARRAPRLRPGLTRALVGLGQAATVAFVFVAVLGQRNRILPPTPRQWPIFSVGTLATAGILALVAAAIVLVARRPVVGERLAWLVRDTRGRRIACLLVAAGFVVAWELLAISTDRSVGDTGLMNWTLDDPFAILNGRTPLVDYESVYAQLSPYLAAGAMALFGTTTLVYTIALTSLSGLALLAIYAVFRRVTVSPLLALVLFLPFLATGFLEVVLEDGKAHLSNVEVLAMWPMRYGGAYLMAWLTARHLDGAGPRRAWALLGVAGVVALDNLEFGIAALAATLVALVCAGPGPSRRSLVRLAVAAASGLLAAAALVSLFTLVRSGSLPDPALLVEYPRIFSQLGLFSVPMPPVGFQLVLYATYIAAIVVAVVRRVRGADHLLLTGMLAWSGTFGLISGGYYLGRSDILKLVSLFSAWSFALMLLVVVVVRALAARERRLPTLAELAVLFGFGLALCSLREVPSPWGQLDRLTATYAPAKDQAAVTRFVALRTRPGERVAILMALGHRTAYELGLDNVSPYVFFEAIVTRRQFQRVIDAARREHVHKLFFPGAYDQQLALLARAGFHPRAAVAGMTELVDR